MKRRYGMLLTLMFLISISLGFSNFRSNDNDKQTYQSKYNKIRVLIDDNYPPYIFRDSEGKLQGILMDQWSLWEKKTGIKVEIHAMEWNAALSEMKNGEYDVIDTIFINDERRKIFDFTKPYAKIEVPIYYHSNISGITGVSSLGGFSVAAKKGDNCIDILKASGINRIEEFDSYEAIIKAAKDKKIVVFVMDKPPALYLMYKNKIYNDFNEGASLYSGEFHRAVKKGDIELLNTVEKGFTMISSSEYKTIEYRWIGKSNNYQHSLLYAIYFATAILIVIAFLIIWNRTLKKKVNASTAQLTGALQKLKVSENRNRAIIRAIPDLVFVLNNEGRFLDFLSNSQSQGLYIQPEDFLGKYFYNLFPREISELFGSAIEKLIDTEDMQVIEYPLMIKGEVYFFEARIAMCGTNMILAMVRDITGHKEAEKRIYELNVYDGLTNLYNRNYFESEIKRYEEHQKINIGLVICDLDGLKKVNDTLGHAEGDNYIRTAAEILRTSFRKQDMVARIGGDEFAIIMENVNEEDISNMKNKVEDTINKLNDEQRPIPISISIGYSILKDKNKTLIDVFKEADNHMYQEKASHHQSRRSKE